MDALEKIPPLLREHARSLEDLGLSDLAWPLDRIDDVLRAIKEESVAILGGDVYEEHGGRLRATYDNWECEREPAEPFTDYAQRSWQRAWEYLFAYPRHQARNVYVVLVLSTEPTAGM